ncbi:MAG: hypothetical protein Kow0077_09820 [Anaerolineae bacterium]
MLPPIEADEQLIAHGLYRQLRRGVPTKIQEFWSVHALADQATIWRSQLLYEGVMTISACYLLRNPAFRPVQLVFYWRWHDGREDMIEYRFQERHMTILHQNQVQDMILPAHFEVYGWHTVTENLVWRSYDQRRRGTQHMTLVLPGVHRGTLWPALAEMDVAYEQTQIAAGPGGPHSAQVFAVTMPEVGPQTLYLDQHGVPLRWALSSDEQLVVELQEYIRFA